MKTTRRNQQCADDLWTKCYYKNAMDQIENFLFRILVTQKKIHRQKGIKMQRKSINRSFTHSSLRSRSSRFHLSASIDLVFSRTPKKMDPPMPIHRTRGSMPCHFPTQSDQPLRAHEIQQPQTWDASMQLKISSWPSLASWWPMVGAGKQCKRAPTQRNELSRSVEAVHAVQVALYLQESPRAFLS